MRDPRWPMRWSLPGADACAPTQGRPMHPDSLDILIDRPAPASVRADAAPSLSMTDRPDGEPAKFPAHGCGALVLGGSHGALGVVRSLGRHGVPVWFATDDNVFARLSRYTTTGLAWPGPNGAGAAEFLLELARRHRLDGWVLVPCADEEARLVSQNHAALSAVFRVRTLPWDVMQWAYDKHRMNERAAALGLDLPRSCAAGSREDLLNANLR